MADGSRLTEAGAGIVATLVYTAAAAGERLLVRVCAKYGDAILLG